MFAEDVRGLQRELLAVRSLNEQQREEMAQQLRWTEEQYIKAIRLWQSAQEEDRRKLQENLVRNNTHLEFSGKLGGLAEQKSSPST